MPTPTSLAARPRAVGGPSRLATNVALALIMAIGFVIAMGAVANADAAPVGVGTAGQYAILAGSTITNTNTTTVVGDIGLHPGTSVTGYGPGSTAIVQTGALHVTDQAALDAKNAATGAYNNAAAQPADITLPTAELGTQILTRGVYTSAPGTFEINGVLTLDAGGDPNAVFIFKMASTLLTGSGSSVVLINGASPCNVFWQVGSSATLGTGSSLAGTIMADQSITLTSGAAVQGRVWASIGAVTLDNNTITNACYVPVTAPVVSTTPSASATPTPSSTPTPTTTPQVSATPTGSVATGLIDADGRTDVVQAVVGFSMMVFAAAVAWNLRRRRTA